MRAIPSQFPGRSMTSLRQVAKRVLPPQTVDWLRQNVRRRQQASSVAVRRPPGPTEEYMIGLEARLWATGDDLYVKKLGRAISLTPRGSRARARGSMALARWHFGQGRPDRAIECLDGVHSEDSALRFELDLLRVDCHCELGQGQAALSYLSRMTRRGTTDQNLLLRVGRTRTLLEMPATRGSGPAIEALNAVYRASGFRMIRRRDVSSPVGLDNVVCEAPAAEPREALPLVTVIVPIDDGTADGFVALQSLLDQSWRNLEILLVGSNVDRSLVVDERVTIVPNDEDDPWSAGLARASGGILTSHALGSWAHPERIEAQARLLLSDASIQATMSSHIRVGSDLAARPLGLAPRPRLVGPNPDSIMVRSGLAPDEILAVRRRILSGYSSSSGDPVPLTGVVTAAEQVPLTLTPPAVVEPIGATRG